MELSLCHCQPLCESWQGADCHLPPLMHADQLFTWQWGVSLGECHTCGGSCYLPTPFTSILSHDRENSLYKSTLSHHITLSVWAPCLSTSGWSRISKYSIGDVNRMYMFHRHTISYRSFGQQYDICQYHKVCRDTVQYRRLWSIWDYNKCQFNTVSYIFINSQKTDKMRFDHFITELFSGNIILFMASGI